MLKSSSFIFYTRSIIAKKGLSANAVQQVHWLHLQLLANNMLLLETVAKFCYSDDMLDVQYTLTWAQPSPHPKRHLNLFSRFCTALKDPHFKGLFYFVTPCICM